MCDATLAFAGIQAAVTAYSIKEQSNQAKYQNDLAEYNTNRQNEALQADNKYQNTQLNMQEAEEADAVTDEKMRIQRETQKRVAEARVSASEGGVAGLSIDSLVNDIIRQGANNVSTVQRNFESSSWQRGREKEALYKRTQYGLGRHTEYRANKLAKSVGSALQIAGSGAQAYRNAGGTFTN
ncbi:virion core protein, T7 gp14 family [Zooshikella sp. RANM57]|uniref:virion core protein, T7 gp14 family n=1 Tax=Zooshikella sp. RANM57 TaxID=3425863 RepID=UPI003D6EB16E